MVRHEHKPAIYFQTRQYIEMHQYKPTAVQITVYRPLIMRTKEYLVWCMLCFARLMSLKIGLISREVSRAALFLLCIFCRPII